MDILLVESDRYVRDLVKVGLQQFQEFTVTWGEEYAGLNELRQRRFDCVFLGVDPAGEEGIQLLDHMRSFDRTTELVVMAGSRQIKSMAGIKARYGIVGFIHTPIVVADFFRFLGRFRERRLDRAAQSGGHSGAHSGVQSGVYTQPR